ncbi:heat shock 70 kda protein-like protein [Cotonvirus japonicus]|uniref:Heat shock 70 kDa protein-like protein n=1 Tax=Cotonvirus japonicus TaxID=2811091 RepID=A0ABM7NS74_9VIRU|nr:heat shock 70 kda protein-like protein [Cotonvirus japonicus]BCS83008.1 heat shock 70 kda protein-like protein [Cotonvirus japonicus]
MSNKLNISSNIANDSYNEDNVIGIDLGTRFSCVSVWRNKRFEIIPDQFGNRTIPSVVSFYKSAKLVGHNALCMKDVNPKNTIYDIKRIIGRRINDESIDQIKNLISYNLIDDDSKHKNILIELDKSDYNLTHKHIYRPEEICAYILTEIKNMATTYLHKEVLKAVITVPAYFNDAQRQATLDSAKIAGLDVIKIINEPTAAALTYGLGNKNWKNNNGNVIIYDLGAGTLDVSLMNIDNGVFRTLAVGGNTHLGGEDIDYVVMNHIIIDFQKKHRIKNMKLSKLSQLKLKNSVENAKKLLSTVEKSSVCVDDFYNGKKLYYVLTREFFEIICNELFIMCIKPLKDVLDSAEMSRHDIDEVILVGGSTRIPKIQNLILNFFKNTSITKLTCTLNPDEVVSAGASIYGYIMTHKDDPFSENLVLLDITPLSLGVETLQRQMTAIIPRNTVIPTKKVKMFSTDSDYQDTVSIKIFEGERKLTKNNFHVGTFDLSGFEKGPRGFPVIKITFHIDINGILQVTAHEKKSDVQNTMKITSTWGAKGRLSKTDIDNIIADATKYEEIDKLCTMKIGIIHKINTMCSTIIMNLDCDDFNLTNADKRKIRHDIKHTLNWLKNKNHEDLELSELDKQEKRLGKLYAPLIIQINKNNNEFKDINVSSNVADVHGDDEENDGMQEYEKIELNSDPSEYEKQEIKALISTIRDLCRNIINVVNNPISKFTKEDIDIVTDYLDTIQIWTYTNTATTTIEFIAKINEINKFTEEIMKKYEDNKFFEKNDNFTIKDELQLTCLTLNECIRSKYFSLKKSELDVLNEKIKNTMLWLLTHQNEDNLIYKEKLEEISLICNNIYQEMHNIKELENIKCSDENQIIYSDSSDSDTDETINSIDIKEQIKNKIGENISDLINDLPDKIMNQKSKISENDVLLKIDLNKLNSNTNIKYKTMNKNNKECQL